jgi:hypothetical protein
VSGAADTSGPASALTPGKPAATLPVLVPTRTRKLRQAAFAYLHVGILYESAVLVMAQQGLLPASRGPVWVWLVIGALIVAVIFWGLWFRQSVWLARVVWALHALRLPALISRAFFPAAVAAPASAAIPSSFYLVALGVVLVNLWMLARAGWDL